MPKQITYPAPLQTGGTIAVVAPSSGVRERLHQALDQSKAKLEKMGFEVIEGTVRFNQKLVSASREVRAAELQRFLLDPSVAMVFPVWGGEILMEILQLLDWERLQATAPKWVLGYSDISTFLLVYTLRTGHATAHGTNYLDIRASKTEPVTDQWHRVLATQAGESVEQASSEKYQSSWQGYNPVDGFALDTPTVWKCLGQEDEPETGVEFSGRLLGGCVETIAALIGTPYAPVKQFVQDYCSEDGVIWYLETTENNAADIYRKLWQMKQNGWFDRANGILFGRPDSYTPTQDFELNDALQAVFADLGIPVIYDVDTGHVPPQVTLVNGAYAEVRVQNGKGTVRQTFR